MLADGRAPNTIVTMSYSGLRVNDTSRKVIDTAIGVLVGLRGCSPDQAFAELVRVVHDSGVGIGTLAAGLVALAGGGSSAGHAEAFNAWGELVRRRPLESVASTP